ncbi:MAG: HlyC/CorC family transporter [Clostridia bacterium]|nr:HlyC/CorC family transporter [Clostridia bacterium]
MDPYLPTMLATNMATNIVLSLSIVLLLCCSAFFSSAETTFTTVSNLRFRSLAENKVKGARKAVYISENYKKTLTTILVGNNLVNIACTTICAYLFSILIKNPTLANVLNTVVMTIIVLIFGEILPKALGKMNGEKLALKFSGTLFLLMKIMTPITLPFLALQNKMVKSKDEATPTVTEDELESIIDTMEEEGVIDSEDADLIQSVLDLNQNTAYDIMVPRVDVKAVNVYEEVEVVEKVFKETQFTRLPVYKDTIDNIIGIISQKDLFFAMVEGVEVSVAKLMSEPLNITETMKVDDIIREMQKSKKHMAIVLDEHGGTSGIVTLEDAIEQIVGKIYDEHDDVVVEEDIVKIDDFDYRVTPDTEIADLFEYLKIEHLPESQYSKLDGFIFEQLEDVPEQGAKLEYMAIDDILQDDASIIQRKVKLTFTLTKVEENRIREIMLHVEPLEEEKDSL